MSSLVLLPFAYFLGSIIYYGQVSNTYWIAHMVSDSLESLRYLDPSDEQIALPTRLLGMSKPAIGWLLWYGISTTQHIPDTIFGWLPLYCTVRYTLFAVYMITRDISSGILFNLCVRPLLGPYEETIDLTLGFITSVTTYYGSTYVTVPYWRFLYWVDRTVLGPAYYSWCEFREKVDYVRFEEGLYWWNVFTLKSRQQLPAKAAQDFYELALIGHESYQHYKANEAWIRQEQAEAAYRAWLANEEFQAQQAAWQAENWRVYQMMVPNFNLQPYYPDVDYSNMFNPEPVPWSATISNAIQTSARIVRHYSPIVYEHAKRAAVLGFALLCHIYRAVLDMPLPTDIAEPLVHVEDQDVYVEAEDVAVEQQQTPVHHERRVTRQPSEESTHSDSGSSSARSSARTAREAYPTPVSPPRQHERRVSWPHDDCLTSEHSYVEPPESSRDSRSYYNEPVPTRSHYAQSRSDYNYNYDNHLERRPVQNNSYIEPRSSRSQNLTSRSSGPSTNPAGRQATYETPKGPQVVGGSQKCPRAPKKRHPTEGPKAFITGGTTSKLDGNRMHVRRDSDEEVGRYSRATPIKRVQTAREKEIAAARLKNVPIKSAMRRKETVQELPKTHKRTTSRDMGTMTDDNGDEATVKVIEVKRTHTAASSRPTSAFDKTAPPGSAGADHTTLDKAISTTTDDKTARVVPRTPARAARKPDPRPYDISVRPSPLRPRPSAFEEAPIVKNEVYKALEILTSPVREKSKKKANGLPRVGTASSEMVIRTNQASARIRAKAEAEKAEKAEKAILVELEREREREKARMMEERKREEAQKEEEDEVFVGDKRKRGTPRWKGKGKAVEGIEYDDEGRESPAKKVSEGAKRTREV